MKYLLNPLYVFKNLENGQLYIKPLSIISSIIIIALDLLIISNIEDSLINIFTNLNIDNNFIFNIAVFIIQMLTALISINIILFIIKDKNPTFNYCSNITKLDYIHVIILILGFRLLYEGSIYQFRNLLSINLDLNSALLSCIYAPVIEEVIYRGFILNGLIKKYSSIVALIISSLLFGIMHFNLFQSINAFLIGIIIGYIFIKTKSIYLCIFLHFCNNFIVLYLPSVVFNSLIVHFIYVLFNICLGSYLIFISLNKMKLEKRSKVFKDNDSSSNFFI